MSFDQAAVNALVSAAVSHAEVIGAFRSVVGHEPKAAPGSGLRAAVWVQRIRPITSSGLAETSGVVTLNVRAYNNMLEKPEDDIDPRMLAAISMLMDQYTGDFTFGGTIRNIDLLGMYGESLEAESGFIDIANTMYRQMTLTVPCVINDLWVQGGIPSAEETPGRALQVDSLGVTGGATIGGSLTVDGTVTANGVTDWLNVKAEPYNAAGNGTADDTAAIQAALNAANAKTGGVVYLPWGEYLVSSPLSVPPYVHVIGETFITLNLFTAATTQARLIIAPGFTPNANGGGLLQFCSQTPGGWSIAAAHNGARQIFIDGSQCSNTSVQGINFCGPVYDTHLEDVFIWKSPRDGVTCQGFTESGITPTYPYHQRWRRLSVANAGFTGADLTNLTDSSFDDCITFANGGNGVNIHNNSNSLLRGWKSEWNTGRNYDITGQSGSVVLAGCEGDNGYQESVRIHSATGQVTDGGGIVIAGGKHHGSGQNGGSNDFGIRITGSTVPVVISGVNVEVTNGSNGAHPATGLEIDTSSNVTVTGSVLQGITAAYSDGGGNSNVIVDDCIQMTGDPGSQVTSLLTAVRSTPGPEDAGFLAWNFDLALIGNSTALSSGNVYLQRIDVHRALTVTNVCAAYVTAGNTLTSSECFAGLYNSAGVLVGTTADQSAAWVGTAQKVLQMPLSGGPFIVSPGFYWVAFLANGTTGPALGRLSSISNPADYINSTMTAATYRIANVTGSKTTLPASITPASNAQATVQAFWAGLS
jgi:hypothetical protein